MNNHIIYQSEYIKNNIADIILHTELAHQTFEKLFSNADSTWSYNKYNIFSLAGPSTIFYNMFKELQGVIIQQLGTDTEMWMQCWVNYMTYEELDRLDWHSHDFDYHGYISIDPKNTYTDFKDYAIENTAGQIYFGPGHRPHKVVAHNMYEGTRITLGFDVVSTNNNSFIKNIHLPWNNLSFIPL